MLQCSHYRVLICSIYLWASNFQSTVTVNLFLNSHRYDAHDWIFISLFAFCFGILRLGQFVEITFGCVCGRRLPLCHQESIYIIHNTLSYIERNSRCDDKIQFAVWRRLPIMTARCKRIDDHNARIDTRPRRRRQKRRKNSRNAKNAAPCCFTLTLCT